MRHYTSLQEIVGVVQRTRKAIDLLSVEYDKLPQGEVMASFSLDKETPDLLQQRDEVLHLLGEFSHVLNQLYQTTEQTTAFVKQGLATDKLFGNQLLLEETASHIRHFDGIISKSAEKLGLIAPLAMV